MPAQAVIHRLFTEPEDTAPLEPLEVPRLSRAEKQRLLFHPPPEKYGPVKTVFDGEYKTIAELAKESHLRYVNGKVGWEK